MCRLLHWVAGCRTYFTRKLWDTAGDREIASPRSLEPALNRGLFYVADPMVRHDLNQGVLRTVLDDWSPLGPGFHIYYSSRGQIPAALRLFIELVRELKPLGL